MLAFDIDIRQWSLNMFGHVATPDMSRKSFKRTFKNDHRAPIVD